MQNTSALSQNDVQNDACTCLWGNQDTQRILVGVYLTLRLTMEIHYMKVIIITEPTHRLYAVRQYHIPEQDYRSMSRKSMQRLDPEC